MALTDLDAGIVCELLRQCFESEREFLDGVLLQTRTLLSERFHASRQFDLDCPGASDQPVVLKTGLSHFNRNRFALGNAD